MLRSVFSLVVLFYGVSVFSQVNTGLVMYFDFANCEAVDRTGNNPLIQTAVPPMCDCGISSDAFEFDGGGQSINFDETSNINALFTRATFSVSFYIRSLVNTGYMSVISKRESCLAQRGFDVYYNAQSGELITELTETPTNQLRVSNTLANDRCWHHVVIIRSGTNLRIFINNRLVTDRRTNTVVDLTNEAPLQIGRGACVGNTAIPFNGLLSDFRIYNRDIQPLEVASLFRNQDKLVNRDTTIFLGQDVVINAGPSCTDMITWSPIAGISDLTSPTPVITPNETTLYIVSKNYGNCIARDSVNITVIDPATLDCTVLPMANAFTPNSDGLNDSFGISNPFTLEELISFEIYDRNGTPIFVTDSPFDQWDGSFRGSLMPPGAYLYMIKYICDGESIVKSGTFHLIR